MFAMFHPIVAFFWYSDWLLFDHGKPLHVGFCRLLCCIFYMLVFGSHLASGALYERVPDSSYKF